MTFDGQKWALLAKNKNNHPTATTTTANNEIEM